MGISYYTFMQKSIFSALLTSTLCAGGATVLGRIIVTDLAKLIPGVGGVVRQRNFSWNSRGSYCGSSRVTYWHHGIGVYRRKTIPYSENRNIRRVG
jgi:hypothetical protein